MFTLIINLLYMLSKACDVETDTPLQFYKVSKN